MATAPILDLTTDHDRPFVRINGTAYVLRTSQDLTLAQFKTLERLAPRVSELLEAPNLSGAEAGEADRLIAEAAAMALVAPPEVMDGLGTVNQVLVAVAFFARLTPSLQRMSEEMEARPSRSVGMKPSRGSSAATAARPKPGSPGRRSGSSARA